MLVWQSASARDLLDDALTQHTSHPRYESLVSLIARSPTRERAATHAVLYVAVEAGGEGQGHRLDDRGLLWRLGDLPLV